MRRSGVVASCEVFNLETQSGTYVVGGILAHNCDRFAASTFQQTIDHFAARYRVAVSADERRKDRKEFLIYDMFGEKAADVNREELADREFVHDVEVRMVPTEYAPGWFVDAADKSMVAGELLDDMIGNAQRNALVVELARREAADGHRVLLFSHRVAHCEELVGKIRAVDPGRHAGLLLGGTEREPEFRKTRAQLADGGASYGVGTYQAIGYGVDMPAVARGVACTPLHNNRSFWGQVRGRLCRRSEGKTEAVLYYPWDVGVYGRKPLENMLKWNRRVTVRDGAEWVDGRKYLEGMRR